MLLRSIYTFMSLIDSCSARSNSRAIVAIC